MRSAVAEMYRRVFRPPFEIPLALVTNAVLVTLAWFLVPPRVHDWLFGLHGPLAFPVVVASWMLGDTPSTNVAGLDTTKALSVLEDAAAFRMWLLARSVVLTSLVGVPTAIIALVMGFQGQPVVKVVATCVVLAILPFGILPIAAWLGLLLPYHPKTIRWRWDHRRDCAGLPAGGCCCSPPSSSCPPSPPSSWLPRSGSPTKSSERHSTHSPTSRFVLVAVTICATALLSGWVGLWGAGRLRIRQHDRLASYLRNPSAG